MQIKKIVEVYRSLARNPTPESARIIRKMDGPGNRVTVAGTWSQRNLETGKFIKFQQLYCVDGKNVTDKTIPVDISPELISAVSKSEKIRCVVRQIFTENNRNFRKQYLEIWKQNQLYLNIDLTSLDVHGDVYADNEFAAMDWSPCESKVIYIAEKKQPRLGPFYKPNKPRECKEDAQEGAQSDEYIFREDWGEQFAGKHLPVAVICDINAETLTVLDFIPSSHSTGQVTWTPDGKGIVGVAWKNEPQRLGMLYCTNRNSVVFHLSLDGQFSVLSPENEAVRTPRFSPDGNYLAWLQRPAGGTGSACIKLMCCTWKTKQVNVVIDIVQQHISTVTGVPFYGLYGLHLTHRCWTSDSKRVLFSTVQRCLIASFVVNVENGSICELDWEVPQDVSQGSRRILDVCDDLVIIARSSLKEPGNLFLGRLASAGQEKNTQWIPITARAPPPDLATCQVQYMSLEAESSTDTIRDFNAFYIGPNSDEKQSVPLIVFPHGGPHVCAVDDFNVPIALMVAMGYGVLQVNYRGSTGSGQNCVDFLLGKIGDADVKDVYQATQTAFKKFSSINRKRCALYGGSHGGLMVAHLSAEYPNTYHAVVARNPVIDIASMSTGSDIPDWCYVEVGVDYNLADQSGNTLDKMRHCSPIQHLYKVKAPTLLLLGKNDSRVPYSQGVLYHRLLHCNGIKTKVKLYDDGHALTKISVEMDGAISLILWFNEHLSH